VLFKIVTKVMNNRAILVADEVISKSQSAFIKGRFILDSVVILHETMHYIHKKKKSGISFKVDFEKAYDKINWEFMFLVLEMKGFPTKFIELTRKVVENGKVNIMVNDKVGSYFVTRKGLRQGDPFSPILFNVAADVLATLISRAQEQGFIKGLIPEMYEGGLSLLQYADDTIFMFEDNLEYARNLKIILCTFEHLTGLKINFSKSEVYCFGSAVEKQEEYAYIFTCKVGEIPFRYLGMPVHYKRLSKIDWRPAEEKVENKCPCWQGGYFLLEAELFLQRFSLVMCLVS
jgi:hypothetical protein